MVIQSLSGERFVELLQMGLIAGPEIGQVAALRP
jgi:hypothetical protein